MSACRSEIVGLIMVTLGSITLVGCGRRVSTVSAVRDDAPSSQGCRSNLQCTQDGQRCIGGQCRALNAGCTSNGECSAEQFCEIATGSCMERAARIDECSLQSDCTAQNDKYCDPILRRCVECINNDQCPPDTICRRSDGSCGKDDRCTRDTDCTGLVCDTDRGLCVPCNASIDCPLGQSCREHQCFVDEGPSLGTDSVLVPCQTQAECDPYGKVCDKAKTKAKCIDCTAPDQCGIGRTCARGTCVANSSEAPPKSGAPGSCATDAECGGQVCTLNFFCSPCFSDFMCNTALSGLAEKRICEQASGKCTATQCSSATQCAPGLGCFRGHCTSCVYDTECRINETCNAGSCSAGDTSNAECSNDTKCSDGRVCDLSLGLCVDCTVRAECDAGYACVGNPLRCTLDGGGAFGSACVVGKDTCAGDLSCLDGVCTRLCVGNGRGGQDDCDLGYYCRDYDTNRDVSTVYDGVRFCVPGESPTDATIPPDTACREHAECQTGVCWRGSTCAAACLSNNDCLSVEGCWQPWNDSVPTGAHLCFPTSVYGRQGDTCTHGNACESGACVGTCDNSGRRCNHSGECAGGNCAGTCEEHCRTDADCPSDRRCALWPFDALNGGMYAPICQQRIGNGTKTLGALCSTGAECSTDVCMEGKCTHACGTDADCQDMASARCRVFTIVDTRGLPDHSGAFCK